MAAQTQGAEHVVKAYVFVVRYGDNGEHHTEAACIAGSHAEAVAILTPRYADFYGKGKVSFFNTAVAVMQPAMIERWEDTKRIEENGCYAFLKGVFFCKCGDHQMATNCKQEKTRTGWSAIIYGANHYIKPL